MILLKDFAEERGIKPGTITQWLRRNAETDEVFGHYQKDKKGQILIDADLEKLLAGKYRALPQMGHDPDDLKKIRDMEAREKILMEKLVALQDKMIEAQDIMSELKANKMLLEMQKTEAEQMLEAEKKVSEMANQRAAEAQQKNEKLTTKLTETEEKLDAAQTEAASYHKTLFGLYRKD